MEREERREGRVIYGEARRKRNLLGNLKLICCIINVHDKKLYRKAYSFREVHYFVLVSSSWNQSSKIKKNNSGRM